MARTYRFQYMHGQSAPYMTLEAADDADFYAKLKQFENGSGMKHVAGTIRCTVSETYQVAEPSSIQPAPPYKKPQGEAFGILGHH